jgi:hypothetical protein
MEKPALLYTPPVSSAIAQLLLNSPLKQRRAKISELDILPVL